VRVYKVVLLLYHTNCYFSETIVLINLTSNWAKPRLLLDLFGAGAITDQVLYVNYKVVQI